MDIDAQAKAQSDRAAEAIAAADEVIFICLPVLIEAVWVMSRRYKISRQGVALVLRRLCAHRGVQIQSGTTVERAADAYEKGTADFADLLIAALNGDAECRTTLTFDKRAARHAHFTLLA
ncbi:MAG: PIN domain-containing protein [Pseudomonadota bacterium]